MNTIRAVALDVDGVLTDGGFWWGPAGQEWKRFSYRDVMGLSLARRAGLVLVLISGEGSEQIDRYAAKMGISAVYKTCRDKAGALGDFSRSSGIPLAEMAFMGDDVNDVPALKAVGLAAAPGDAHSSARTVASFVARSPGGRGAVRELIDLILEDRPLAGYLPSTEPRRGELP